MSGSGGGCDEHRRAVAHALGHAVPDFGRVCFGGADSGAYGKRFVQSGIDQYVGI